MLGITRIVAFDDKQEDLDALISGINGYGATCRGFLYTGNVTEMNVVPCPYVRVVFFDLNMVAGPLTAEFTQNYSTIGSLLHLIEPKGPYLLILWTRYSDRVSELQKHLDKRLVNATKPFNVAALPKDNYIDEDGNVLKLAELISAIKDIIDKSPALAALSDWEERVFYAAAETLSSVTMLGSNSKPSKDQQKDIPRLMASMSMASLGLDNVVSNPFRAVNDALLPVLGDHVATSRLQDDGNKVWDEVIDTSNNKPTLSEEEAAQLNWAFHIAQDFGTNQGAERGAVIPLSSALPDDGFEALFEMDECQAAEKQFRCEDFQRDGEKFQWVLVQAQAACDFAQRQPGPLPFYLGIDIDASASASGSKPAALWKSPMFQMNGQIRELQVNARFHVSLPMQRAQKVKPLYRLREQILGDLIHNVHSNGGRPGMISFRQAK